jgi:hypothetical protein
LDKKIKIRNKDRFIRSFLSRVDESTFLRRFGLGGKGEFLGRRTEKGILLYRKKRGIFNLFALTVQGRFSREGGEDFITLRFARCTPVAILWWAWCAMMLFSGILLLGSWLSLLFLIPALLWAMPLFLFSKKEKNRLYSFILELEG